MNTIEQNELEQLKLLEKDLIIQLSSVQEKINDFELTKLEKKYGKDFCCNNCRYYAVLDSSEGSGWHNKCGVYAAPCTCCNCRCKYYKPDTEMSKWIKEHIKGANISKEVSEALKRLRLYWDMDDLPEEKAELIKDILMFNYVPLVKGRNE